MKKKIITIIVLVVLFAVIIFISSPNLSPLYGGGIAFWAFVISVFSVIFLIQSAGAKNIVIQQQDGVIRPVMPKKGRAYLLVAAAPWVILILLSIYSSVLFHVNRYKNQMPEPEVRQFSADLQPIDISQLPVVDRELAALLADKKLGEKPALGSQVTLGDADDPEGERQARLGRPAPPFGVFQVGVQHSRHTGVYLCLCHKPQGRDL